MNFRCKVWPVNVPHPAFPTERFGWMPTVAVRLVHKHATTCRLEAVIDSGSPSCMFHSDLCKPLGIRKVEEGIPEPLKGIIGGRGAPASMMYFHRVKILIRTECVETMASFCSDLAVAAILGRRGFFENFTVKFDCSVHPPMLELERIHRG